MRRGASLVWIVALLALLPPAALAFLGSHSRLLSDDYCHIAWGAQHGLLGGLQFVRSTWNGSYSNYFVQFLFVSIGEAAPALLAILTIVIWLIGLVWLALIALARLRVDGRRLPLALAVSGLLVAAAINGFQSMQSLYWMSANVAYAMPVAILALIVAAGLQLALRPKTRISAAAGFVAAIALFNAGFTPMFLVFQGAVLSALLLGACLFLRKTIRRRCLILLGAGLLSTAAAALVMLTAPGFWGRLGSSKYPDLNLGPPVRALPELLRRSFEILFEQVGHQPAFTGFALMLCLALCLMLCLYRPPRVPDRLQPAALARRPLWTALIAQLLFLPILWAHTSDSTQFLGRFSLAFFLVVLLNLAQILFFALLLAFRERVDRVLRASESTWRAYIGAVLLAALMLFAIDQARSIHYKAATFLLCSAMAWLGLLLWQLADRHSDPQSRLWRRLPLFSVGAALVSYLALISMSLFALGFLSERILAGAAFMQVASGAIWGLGLGLLLRRGGFGAHSGGLARDPLWLGAAGLTIILTIGIVMGQGQRLPALTVFTAEWDARHGEIIRQRDSGSDAIVVPELSYNLGELVYEFSIFDPKHTGCPKSYYGVASFTPAG